MGKRKRRLATRFGPRYGRKVRGRFFEIEREVRRPKKCPQCNSLRLKRVGTGIWYCHRCGLKFAGAAYRPAYLAGRWNKTQAR